MMRFVGMLMVAALALAPAAQAQTADTPPPAERRMPVFVDGESAQFPNAEGEAVVETLRNAIAQEPGFRLVDSTQDAAVIVTVFVWLSPGEPVLTDDSYRNYALVYTEAIRVPGGDTLANVQVGTEQGREVGFAEGMLSNLARLRRDLIAFQDARAAAERPAP